VHENEIDEGELIGRNIVKWNISVRVSLIMPSDKSYLLFWNSFCRKICTFWNFPI